MGRKRTIFKGSAAAIVTPFDNKTVDYRALSDIIEFQMNNGTDAIVLLGTTGESPTVNEEERVQCIKVAKETIKHRIPLIVGTGSNCTEVAVRYSKSAEKHGADAVLCVTPYYNKATEKGIELHYKEIAKSTNLPIIIYNVPARTGLNIPISAYSPLAKIDNIVGVKEASGNLSYLSNLISEYGCDFDFYSGCDELTLPSLSIGAKGIISVCANIVPSHMHQLCCEFFAGNVAKSTEIQIYLYDLIKELFAEVNPIPVKTAMGLMGLCSPDLRLPLSKSTRKKQLLSILQRYMLMSKKQ